MGYVLVSAKRVINKFNQLTQKLARKMKTNKYNSQIHRIFLARAKKEPRCIKCGRDVRSSFYPKKERNRKYLCRCLCTVSATKGTPLYRTHVSIDTWFKILNDLMKNRIVTIKEIQIKYSLTNSSTWELLRKLKQWINEVEHSENLNLTHFVKGGTAKDQDKMFLVYSNSLKPEEMEEKMLAILPSLFEETPNLKQAA